MLGMIRGLYEVENEVAKLDDEAAKVRYRQEHARPQLETIAAWLKEHRDQVLPKSPLGEAIGYALNNWTALNHYVDVGYLAIDNNPAERSLRAVVSGRKNWLFAGSDAGGRTAAVLYSLVSTCKRLGIEPWAYLRDALARLPELPNERLAELLPDVWRKPSVNKSHLPEPAFPIKLSWPALPSHRRGRSTALSQGAGSCRPPLSSNVVYRTLTF